MEIDVKLLLLFAGERITSQLIVTIRTTYSDNQLEDSFFHFASNDQFLRWVME
jgi:hypothetical protein